MPRLLAALALCVGLLAPSAAQASISTAAPECTVLVVTPLDAARDAYASGVILRQDDQQLTIVTAAHVPNLSRARVLTQRGELLSVTSFHPIPGYDLAILTTSAARQAYRPAVAVHAFSENDAVFVWGYPTSTTPTLAMGTVLGAGAFVPGTMPTGISVLCATCAHGDSSAGIFNAAGALVGILTTGYRRKDGSTVFVVGQPATILAAAL